MMASRPFPVFLLGSHISLCGDMDATFRQGGGGKKLWCGHGLAIVYIDARTLSVCSAREVQQLVLIYLSVQ